MLLDMYSNNWAKVLKERDVVAAMQVLITMETLSKISSVVHSLLFESNQEARKEQSH